MSNINRPTILVVNDNFVILDVLTYRLEPFFTVTVTDCGMDAIQVITGQPRNYFDVIMMDINMPMMDGFETISKIKAILAYKRSSGLAKMLSLAKLPSLASKAKKLQRKKSDFIDLLKNSLLDKSKSAPDDLSC